MLVIYFGVCITLLGPMSLTMPEIYDFFQSHILSEIEFTNGFLMESVLIHL